MCTNVEHFNNFEHKSREHLDRHMRAIIKRKERKRRKGKKKRWERRSEGKKEREIKRNVVLFSPKYCHIFFKDQGAMLQEGSLVLAHTYD